MQSPLKFKCIDDNTLTFVLTFVVNIWTCVFNAMLLSITDTPGTCTHVRVASMCKIIANTWFMNQTSHCQVSVFRHVCVTDSCATAHNQTEWMSPAAAELLFKLHLHYPPPLAQTLGKWHICSPSGQLILFTSDDDVIYSIFWKVSVSKTSVLLFHSFEYERENRAWNFISWMFDHTQIYIEAASAAFGATELDSPNGMNSSTCTYQYARTVVYLRFFNCFLQHFILQKLMPRGNFLYDEFYAYLWSNIFIIAIFTKQKVVHCNIQQKFISYFSWDKIE